MLGSTYGRLTVQNFSHTGEYYTKFYKCSCSCGNYVVVSQGHLRSGHTKSCGCYQVENPSRLTHGDAGTSLYKVYYAMLGRCHVPEDSGYYKYGAKGITVCTEWRDSYELFKDWATSHGYQKGLTIDREDGTKGYSPQNCRWVANSVQAINKGKSVRNTSGYLGVSFNKTKGVWVARVTVKSQRIEVAKCSTALEAHKAYMRYLLDNNLLEHLKAAAYA